MNALKKLKKYTEQLNISRNKKKCLWTFDTELNLKDEQLNNSTEKKNKKESKRRKASSSIFDVSYQLHLLNNPTATAH